MLQLNIPFIHNQYVEIIIRALAVYVFMIVAIRLFGKKELSQLSIIDLVFILLISNAVQNAMVGSDTSLGGGLTAALALFAANYTLKKIMYKNKTISKLVQGEALMLIYNGKILQENCDNAKITIAEIEQAVREHGVESITKVDLAILEVDGNISVISESSNAKTTKHRRFKKPQHEH